MTKTVSYLAIIALVISLALMTAWEHAWMLTVASVVAGLWAQSLDDARRSERRKLS